MSRQNCVDEVDAGAWQLPSRWFRHADIAAQIPASEVGRGA